MRILLWFSAAFVASSGIALYLSTPAYTFAFSLILLSIAVGLCVSKQKSGVVWFGLAIGLLWTLGYQHIIQNPAEALADRTMTVSGTATSYSTETSYGTCVSAVITCDQATAKAIVYLDTEDKLCPGDSFTVTVTLKITDSAYFRSDGIFLIAYGTDSPEIYVSETVPIRYLPAIIAHRLELSLELCVPADALGYATALTTGNRDGLTDVEKNTLKAAGVYHALALSGMHMSVLMGSLSLFIRRKRTLALWGIPICILFTLITGASASIVRAAVMQCILLFGHLIRREADPPTSLGAAALFICAQNPWCVFSWSVQLSFISTAGILLLSPGIYSKLCQIKARNPDHPSFFRKCICTSLSTTLSAMLCATPLMMAYWGMVSLVAPLSNLLTGWVITWCFRWSLLVAIIGTVCTPVGSTLGLILAWLICFVKWVAFTLASLPYATVDTGYVCGFCWVILVYVILAITFFTPGETSRPYIPCCCVILSLIAVLFLRIPESNVVLFQVLDVGQGQCLMLQSNGYTVLIDCGGSSAGDMAVNAVHSSGETCVDALILTHYDTDHTSGVSEVLQRLTVTTLFIPDTEESSSVRSEIESTAESVGTAIFYVTAETTLSLGTGRVDIYPPVTNLGGNSGLCILADLGEIEILVTGDMDTDLEAVFLQKWNLPDIDILVAGHHGSKYSTSLALLETVSPEIVVISVGENNNYGHPSDETLQRISVIGATVYRTDQIGTITLKGA